MVDTVAVPQNMQAVANGIPVYYQIPVVDGTGNVVQRLPIERSVRKSSNSGVASLDVYKRQIRDECWSAGNNAGSQ